MLVLPSDCCCSWPESASVFWLYARIDAAQCECKIMAPTSSGDHAINDNVTDGDDEFVLFAGSTESLTWWTTGWWITQHLTGEQRSVHRNLQSIIREFCLGGIRSLRCTNLIFLQPFTSHLLNKWMQRYSGSEGDHWPCLLDYIFGSGLLILWFMWVFLFFWMFWTDMLS